MKIFISKKGFTMIEIVLALAILGAVMGTFYTMWNINFSSFDEHMVRADLWQEADRIIEKVSDDARLANHITVTGPKTADFIDRDNKTFVEYQMLNNGEFQVKRSPDLTFKKLANFVNFDNSFFEQSDRGLKLNLQLSQNTVGRTMSILAATEIFPRN